MYWHEIYFIYFTRIEIGAYTCMYTIFFLSIVIGYIYNTYCMLYCTFVLAEELAHIGTSRTTHNIRYSSRDGWMVSFGTFITIYISCCRPLTPDSSSFN